MTSLTIQGNAVKISDLIGEEFHNLMSTVQEATMQQQDLVISSHDCFLLEHTVDVMLELIHTNLSILTALQKSGALIVEKLDDDKQ